MMWEIHFYALVMVSIKIFQLWKEGKFKREEWVPKYPQDFYGAFELAGTHL